MAKEPFQLLVKHLKARFGMGAGPQQLTLKATQTLTGVSPTPKANPLTASSHKR